MIEIDRGRTIVKEIVIVIIILIVSDSDSD